MPPQLAFIIVLTFIGCVIYIEHKKTKNISGAVWIIAIWILYSGSKGLGFFLNIHTTIEAGSLPDRYFMLSLGIISIIIIIQRHFSITTSIKNNVSAVLLLIYSLISVLWSRDPGISFRKWGREAVAIIIALLLCSEKYPIITLSSALKKAIYMAMPLSVLLIKYYPALGRSYGRWTGEIMWEGIATQKNGLSMLCAVSIIFLICSLVKCLADGQTLISRWPILIDILMIIMSFYLLMGPRRTLTYSATSLLALIIGIVLLGILSFTVKIELKNKLVFLAIAIMVIGTWVPFSGSIPLKKLPKIVNRSETLTDRTEIWNVLLPYAKKKLIFGHGFGGFWTTSLREEIASHSHNGYLETILNLGIVGLLLLSIFLINIIIKLNIFIYPKHLDYMPFLAIIFMYLVHNISEATLGDFQSFLGSIIIMISFVVNREQTLKRQSLN